MAENLHCFVPGIKSRTMKLSFYTFIALLIALIATPTFSQKPEGESKRYKIVLEGIKPVAERKTNAQATESIGKAIQSDSDTNDAEPESATEANSNKWWKPWGKKDAEPMGSGKESEVGQQKREENSRKWWNPWSESEPEEINKPVQASAAPSQEKAKAWWRPWSQDAPQSPEAEEEIVTTQETPDASNRKWWKPWSESEPESEQISEELKSSQEQPQEEGNKWWKPWWKEDGAKQETEKTSESVQEENEANTNKWWKPRN